MSSFFTKTRTAIVLGAALVLAVVIFAVTQGIGNASVPDGDVVVVDTDVDVPAAGIENGEVSKEAYDRALEQAAKAQGLNEVPDPDSPRYNDIRDQALGDLLDIIWIKAEAAERGITASDREVADQLEQTKNQSFGSEAEYQRFLKQQGYTQEDVDLRVELQILSQKIQEQVSAEAGEASTDDAKKFYEANKASFEQPEQRNVRVIVNKDQDKVNEALKQLQSDSSPQSWKQVASEFSTDQGSKNNGGLRESVTPGLLPPVVDDAVFSADEGTLGGPIKTQSGDYYVYQVESVTPASTQSFDDVAGQITQQLTGQIRQERFATFVGAYRDRWVGATVCADDYVFERCDNFVVSVPKCTDTMLKETGCPPPVLSRAPGGIGSFAPFVTAAAGQPQRPHPAGGEGAAGPGTPGGFQNLPGQQGTTPGG